MYKQAGGYVLLILRVRSIARLLIHSPISAILRNNITMQIYDNKINMQVKKMLIIIW